MANNDHDSSTVNLIIRNATKNHEGKYGCFASNGIEPDLWAEFDVSIEGNVYIHVCVV